MSKKTNSKKSLYPYVMLNGIILLVVGLIVFYLGSLHSIEKNIWRMVAGLIFAINLLMFMIECIDSNQVF